MNNLPINQIICGDCLEVMRTFPDKSIDMILCDLPYQITACSWDQIIPLELLWEQYKRLIRDNRAIVLTASQPFTSKLVMSNENMFKYEWIWEKSRGGNFFNLKNQPWKMHETILVFSNGTVANKSNRRMLYNPQDLQKIDKKWKNSHLPKSEHNNHRPSHTSERIIEYGNYPKSILRYSNSNNQRLHPTQKPVELFEYLIKTYTNEGDLVLDNCAGSCTTAIAADNLKRNWICIEKEETYCVGAEPRLMRGQLPPTRRS